MCVITIVDADSLLVLATRHGPGDSLFLSWIENRHGILAFTDTGQYPDEVLQNHAISELFRRYEQGGQIKKFLGKEVSDAEKQIRKLPHRSNDPHVLALALASGARVLCAEDKKLRKDFKDKEILPQTGRKQRILYPHKGSRKQRREFLNRQRCANRERT